MIMPEQEVAFGCADIIHLHPICDVKMDSFDFGCVLKADVFAASPHASANTRKGIVNCEQNQVEKPLSIMRSSVGSSGGML